MTDITDTTDSSDKNRILEIRTQRFSKDVRVFLKPLSNKPMFFEDVRQLVRSSGSVAANYIEANESLTKKDFLYRIGISRKEAKESMFWLSMFGGISLEEESERKRLHQEASELLKIFSVILRNVRRKHN